MQPLLLNFEPLPNLTHGSPITLRWHLGGSSEGTMKVMISPVEQGCPPLKMELSTDIDIHAKNIHIPLVEIDPGLYIIEAVNQTNQAQILATSHSFYVLAPPTEVETNQMGIISQISSQSPPTPSCNCDHAPAKVTTNLNGAHRAIIGAVLGVGLPALIILSILLWRLCRPHHSRSEDMIPVITPSSPSSPHTGSASKSLRSQSSWNSESTRSYTTFSPTSAVTTGPSSFLSTSSLRRMPQVYVPSSLSCSPLLGSSRNIFGAGNGPTSVRSVDTSAGLCIASPPPPQYSPT